MNNISQKEEIFLNLYTKHKHNETSESIKKTHGHLVNGQLNFESILELGSNYMFMFGKTNSKEMYDFIQKNKVTFSDNKFKSILSVALKREIEVDIDFDKIKEKVFDNYDLVTQQAATFLKEIGCTAKQVNLFTTNCIKMKEIGAELIHDYYLHTHQQLDPKLLEGKHLYSILSEMGKDYDNVRVVFRDAEKKDQWRYEHNLLIMPSKAILMLENKAETEKLFIKIGERLIEGLETNDRSGIPFWQDPVFQLTGMNPKTGYKYGMENQVLLSDDTSARGFKAPLYMSFNDAINTGFAMPKGTKGTPIIQRFGMKGKAIETTSESGGVQPVLDTNGEPQHFWRRAAKTVTVFNIDQLEWKHEDKPDPRIKWIEEFKQPQLKAVNNDDLIAFRDSYLKSIDIPVTRGGTTNYYLPKRNAINLARSEDFKSPLQEISTTFHEDAHAQGHPSKLNRQSLNDYHIDNAHRGFEELLVNVSAQQLVRHYGLDQNEQQQAYNANEDAYNLGWALPAFKKDPLLIVEAMRQSQQCFESMKTRIDAQLKADNVYHIFCKPEPEKVDPAPLAPRHAYRRPANDESKNKSTTKPLRNAL